MIIIMIITIIDNDDNNKKMMMIITIIIYQLCIEYLYTHILWILWMDETARCW